MNLLVLSRQQFEIEMYDYLVELPNDVPDGFWDPVVLSADKVQFENITVSDDCPICFEKKDSFCKLECCKQIMCAGCIKSWFSASVRCPFCVTDVRNCLKK